jgi:hypothetical protein
MKTHYPFYPKAKGFNNFWLKKYRTKLWKKHTDDPREKQLRISSLISLTIPEHPQKKNYSSITIAKEIKTPILKYSETNQSLNWHQKNPRKVYWIKTQNKKTTPQKEKREGDDTYYVKTE